MPENCAQTHTTRDLRVFAEPAPRDTAGLHQVIPHKAVEPAAPPHRQGDGRGRFRCPEATTTVTLSIAGYTPRLTGLTSRGRHAAGHRDLSLIHI